MDYSDSDPFWRCPRCGGLWFYALVAYEKGVWTAPDTYEFEYPDQGFVNSVSTDVKCRDCDHEFNIAKEYQWYRPAQERN
jgi:uncharacterized C2H2 Zn-finger protein